MVAPRIEARASCPLLIDEGWRPILVYGKPFLFDSILLMAENARAYSLKYTLPGLDAGRAELASVCAFIGCGKAK